LAAPPGAAILGVAKGRDTMASILQTLRSLFGGGGDAAGGKPAASSSVEYKGFTIRAEPYKEGGQYQTAGVIAKEIDGVTKEHRFIRADRYAALDDALAFTLAKGKQIVDEQERVAPGRGLFGS
jgi:hypothetical protein